MEKQKVARDGEDPLPEVVSSKGVCVCVRVSQIIQSLGFSRIHNQ